MFPTILNIPKLICVCWFFFKNLSEEILATAEELKDTHLVCILDLCHLGGENVEVIITKVYRMTDIALV